MTTQPADDQTHDSIAPHLVLDPYYEAKNGAIYVHQDLRQVRAPWEDEGHIPPLKAHERFGDIESWAAYLQRFQQHPLVTWNRRGLRAVLDYHGDDGTPGRCQWTAEAPFLFAPEWEAWTGIAHGRGIAHKPAVEFLEDHQEDIREPDAVILMALLRSLRGNVQAKAETTLRPDGTTAVTFAQDKTVRGAGEVELPEYITIGIPVLYGKPDGVRVKVRLRASVDNEAHLALRFSIPAATRVLEETCIAQRDAAAELLGEGYTILRAAD